MNYQKLFSLAKPYLDKNDLGASHTSRVLAIARENFDIPKELEDLTIASIILHNIGGASIKDQYEKGPKIAEQLLRQMECEEGLIRQICQIVGTHHDHPENPPLSFKILFDADKIVMFSPEEFPVYNRRPNFDWNKILDLIYSEKGKKLAGTMLEEREKEVKQKPIR